MKTTETSFDRFISFLFELTEEEKAAIDGNIEMTESLFNEIKDKLIWHDSELFDQFIIKYQHFLPVNEELTDEQFTLEFQNKLSEKMFNLICDDLKKQSQ